MPQSLRQRLEVFFRSEKDYPIFTGLLSGLYPMVFYYSNNYASVNSLPHLLYFSGLFLVVPALLCPFLYIIMGKSDQLRPYRRSMLFVFTIVVAGGYFSQVYFMTLKKKALLILLLIAVAMSVRYAKAYKKWLAFLTLLTIVAGFQLVLVIYRSTVGYDATWRKQPDKIMRSQFKTKPNVYVIEPDGYAGEKAMNSEVYKFDNPFYGWLRDHGFTLYDNTHSNYPASLASNASMFAMKHHHFGKNLASAIEIPNAREVIVAENPAAQLFKTNGYQTFFIAEDEYFQKNFETGGFDFYNISNSQIPYFSKDDVVKKDVQADLKKCMLQHLKNEKPCFFFIEKLLPHHIHFDGTGKANERKVYLDKISMTNDWLKRTVALITANDPNAIIVIASDHGGWVGMESFSEFYATRDPQLLESIYGNLIAIKWPVGSNFYQGELRSNVNLFRVLFAHLSGDAGLLENLQDDASYNYKETLFSGHAVKVIP